MILYMKFIISLSYEYSFTIFHNISDILCIFYEFHWKEYPNRA